MAGRRVRAVRAEVSKLATLPPVWFAIAVTVAAALLLDVAFVTESGRTNGSAGAGAATAYGEPALRATGAVAIGFAMLGILAATSEVTGGQLRVTLCAVPDRVRAATAKVVAVTMFAVVPALLVTGAGLLIAGVAEPSRVARAALGAVAYLVLIADLALGVALLLRGPLASLVVVLGYLAVLGPLLRGAGVGHDVLPDAAGARLWQPGDAAGTAWAGGGAVLAAWVAAAAVLGVAAWCRRDVG